MCVYVCVCVCDDGDDCDDDEDGDDDVRPQQGTETSAPPHCSKDVARRKGRVRTVSKDKNFIMI